MNHAEEIMVSTMNKLALSAALAVCLSACDGDKTLVTQLTTQLGAASDHPCAEALDAQQELNGIADDTRQSSELVDGITVITEQHWYAGLEMVSYYTYADGGDWCNFWNESGVVWE